MTMQSKNQIIESINQLPINEKLLILEAVLKSIRKGKSSENETDTKPEILELAGSINENEATEWQRAITKGRQIDVNEW